MIPRHLPVALRLGRHLLAQSSAASFPLTSASFRHSLRRINSSEFVVQMRHISYFSGPPPSTSTAPVEVPATIPDTSSVSPDAHFTLLEQLQLETVKDFHITDFLGGNSLVKQYDLFSWWSPASWFRLALEYVHFNIDLPWWLTVMCATISLRLVLIFVPIASHRLMGKVQIYKEEIDEFKEKIEEARKCGNFLQTMKAQSEFSDFLKAKNIKFYRQFLIMSLNGAVFMTQFIAVKKLADVAFPGLNTGGLLWFKDLTIPDPYFILPLISAITVAAVISMGAETGGTNQGINPQLQKVMSRVAPVVVFACSTNVSSAIALYWCTSNIISLLFAGLFKIPSVRTFLKIPQLPKTKTAKPYEKTLGQDVAKLISHSQAKKQSPRKQKISVPGKNQKNTETGLLKQMKQEV